MRFAGIDVGSEKHVVAVVDGDGKVVLKAQEIVEDAAGHARLLKLLGSPEGCLVVLEATGNYWRNLFATLADAGFEVSVVNPMRTNRFAQSDLRRTKTDALDAVGIAHFAHQKRPTPTKLPDAATLELRDLVRLRERVVQDMGDAARRLHRLVHLGFPEFTRHVRTLESELATSILAAFSSAEAFQGATQKLAELVYDGRRKVGIELARALVAEARKSVGSHHGEGQRTQVQYVCEDMSTARQRMRSLDRRIEELLEQHEVGKLLMTIDGIRTQTAARLVTEIGDFSRFPSAKKLASYVGAIPAIKHSGKSKPTAVLTHIGHAKLRRSLWMPLLAIVRSSAWLHSYYQRLRDGGKKHKVALMAAMRKLLHVVYSVATNRRPFVPRITENIPAKHLPTKRAAQKRGHAHLAEAV